MKRIVSPEDVQELGAVLFVGAHPDDEIWTAAGVLAAAVQGGQRVACVTATRGEAGLQDESRWPQAKLGEVRTRELEASLAVLGVKEHTWLDYRDGMCGEADDAEAAKQVRAVIEQFRPDTVLTFGPDGYSGHSDHQAMCRWTMRAVQGLEGVRVLWAAVEAGQYEELRPVDEAIDVFFAIERPPLVRSEDCVIDLRLSRELTALKRRAFEAVPSQLERTLASGALDRPGEALARECFIAAKAGVHE